MGVQFVSSASIVEDRGLRAWWSRSERKVVPYVFISPFYILFIVFSVGPLIYALYLSLLPLARHRSHAACGIGQL